MDQFQLIISIVLIISGAVAGLGSPSKQDDTEANLKLNLDGKIPGQTDSSPLTARTQDEEKEKRLGLSDITKSKRTIHIEIENQSGFTWKAINVYFYSGTSDTDLPSTVDTGDTLKYDARKTRFSVRGVVGVLAYYIPSIKKTLAVMFSVPYDYVSLRNWWNVKLYYGEVSASKARYKDMYYHSDPFKGDNGYHEKNIGSNLKIRGSMSSSGKGTLLINVHPHKGT